MPPERLQKIIAAAGIASRRKAEQMIASGLVEVNGHTVTALGSKADPERDHIRVNGKLLRGAERLTRPGAQQRPGHLGGWFHGQRSSIFYEVSTHACTPLDGLITGAKDCCSSPTTVGWRRV